MPATIPTVRVSAKLRVDSGPRKYSERSTMITVTDMKGNVLVWASAGSLGFVGPKKATPFAASKIVSIVAEKMAVYGINEAEVFVKGVGSGRDSALRSFINRGLNVTNIKDKTPIPHNGPRPPKVRRI